MMDASPQISLRFCQQWRQGVMTMVARDFIVQIAEDPLDGIGFGAVAWQPKQDQARMAGQPAADVPGGVNTIVIRHHIHASKARLGIGAVQGSQQVQEQETVLLGSGAVQQPARAEIQCSGEVAAPVLPGRDDFQALPAPNPLCPHLGQQMEFQLIANTNASRRPKPSQCRRIGASRVARTGSSSRATSEGRFHTYPAWCSQRLTVSAETLPPP